MEDRGEGDILNVVFVNDKLTCQSPIEAQYYVARDDPLYFYCGNEEQLSLKDGCYPICNECSDQGKVAKQKTTRAFKPK